MSDETTRDKEHVEQHGDAPGKVNIDKVEGDVNLTREGRDKKPAEGTTAEAEENAEEVAQRLRDHQDANRR